MDKFTYIEEILENIKNASIMMEEWEDDTFYLVLEYIQQAQEELRSIQEE